MTTRNLGARSINRLGAELTKKPFGSLEFNFREPNDKLIPDLAAGLLLVGFVGASVHFMCFWSSLNQTHAHARQLLGAAFAGWPA